MDTKSAGNVLDPYVWRRGTPFDVKVSRHNEGTSDLEL